ncbi:MAG: succinate CoA transferase [Firmicutes bacterium]|nr:succinate CoA transferase [Bacillota bacterium]
MDSELRKRIRSERGDALIVSAEEAAGMIRDGMAVGISGFTNAGYPKAVPHALAQRVKAGGEKVRIDLYSGASVGPEVDTELVEAGVIGKRIPYQTNATLRKAINSGAVDYSDMHLGRSAEFVALGHVKRPDIALVEALAITEDGDLVPTTSVGNVPTFVQMADSVIVKIAMAKPLELEGTADVYMTEPAPKRKPIPITHPGDRIGTPYVKCGWDKIKAIVISDMSDLTRPLAAISEDSRRIGENIITFLRKEVENGRMGRSLLPIQSGVGSVANAVLWGLKESEFEGLTCYTEVIQDSMLDLIKCGKVTVASCTALAPSPEAQIDFFNNIDFFREHVIFRPEEISNSGEVAHRLGLIAMNTALEVDIYGNVNSTHVQGKKIMNGIGGSGDFSRSAQLVIFTTSSVAKDGAISSIVPMCPHVDHTEHEVQVIVTEQGYADLRGLSPKERAAAIIENCAHPDYRDMLRDYFDRACAESPCQTPHILDEAFSWHSRFEKTGSMK